MIYHRLLSTMVDRCVSEASTEVRAESMAASASGRVRSGRYKREMDALLASRMSQLGAEMCRNLEKLLAVESGAVNLAELLPHVQRAFEELESVADRHLTRSGLDAKPLPQLAAAKAASLAQLEFEFAVAKRTEIMPVVNNTFNGPVGAYQTGSHAVANVQQSAGAFANDEQFRIAIETIIDALKASTQIAEEEKRETIEVLSELRHEEWIGPKNKSRVKGLLLGIGPVIQTLADVEGAVKQLKAWGSAVLG